MLATSLANSSQLYLHGRPTLPTTNCNPWVLRWFLPHPQGCPASHYIPPGPTPVRQIPVFTPLSLSRPFVTFYLK